MRKRKIYIISLLVVFIFIAGIVSFEKEIRQSGNGLFMVGLLTIFSPLTVKPIEFHAKIVDQYSNPVEGVVVDYIGSKSVLASGSGPAKITTDTDGSFVIKDAKGDSLAINNLSKLGYQFPEVGRFFMPRGGEQKERFWSDYDRENPFIINAWKVDFLPNVSHKRTRYKVESFGPDIILSFDSGGIRKLSEDEKFEADVIFNFVKRASAWKVEFKSELGGYFPTHDDLMYQAPELGYKSTLLVENTGTRRQTIKSYFKSNNGNIFGSFEVSIRPGFVGESAAMDFTYTVNLDGGRVLVVPALE